MGREQVLVDGREGEVSRHQGNLKTMYRLASNLYASPVWVFSTPPLLSVELSVKNDFVFPAFESIFISSTVELQGGIRGILRAQP